MREGSKGPESHMPEVGGDELPRLGRSRSSSSRARARDNEEPAPPEPTPVGRLARTLARIDETEDLLAEGMPRRRVEGIIARKWGIGRRQAWEYTQAVIDRWMREGSAEREIKRASIRARAQRAYRVAMERKKGYVVQTGDGFEQEVECVPDPDVRGAISALELETRLDGLLEQAGPSLAIGLGDDALKALHLHFYGDGPRPVHATATVVESEPEKLPSGEREG